MDETNMEGDRQSVLAGVQGVNDMAKIRMVGLSCDGDGLSGVCLDINFTNGQGILLPLSGKVHDPEFIRMFEDGRISRPKTDGERVYWNDGPSLSYAEILQLVKGDTE